MWSRCVRADWRPCLLMLGSGLGLLLTDAGQAFNLLLLIGAGTGGLFILRWFWWRINADRVGGDGGRVVAGYFTFVHDGLDIVELAAHEKLIQSLLTTLGGSGHLFDAPESDKTLSSFVAKSTPAVRDGNAGPQRLLLLGLFLGASLHGVGGARRMPRSLPPVLVVRGRIHGDDPLAVAAGSRVCSLEPNAGNRTIVNASAPGRFACLASIKIIWTPRGGGGD